MRAIKILCGLLVLITVVLPKQQSKKTATGPDKNRIIDYHDRLYFDQQPKQIAAAADSGFTVLGRWAWGPCRAVEIMGNYALVGQGSVYQVLDISNPTSPIIVYDTTMDEWVKDIKIKDSLLLIALSHTLKIYRASPPFPLSEIGSFYVGGGFLEDMAISDSLVFLLADYAGVLAINISDPSHPFFRHQFGLIDDDALSISSTGRYVYYGPLGPGFRLFILEYLPDSAFRVKDLDIGGNALSTYISDTLLFVGNSSGKLLIYSITDPWSPRFIDSIQLGTRVLRINQKGNNVYCSTWDSGMVVLNIADSIRPIVAAKSRWRFPYGSITMPRKLVHSDSVLAETIFDGLALYSIGQADSITERYFFPTGGWPTGIALRGNIGFVANGTAGLWSIDFSDVGHPRPISKAPTVDYSVAVALTDTLACVITVKAAYGIPDSLIIVQFDDCGSLTRLSSVDVGGVALSVAAQDSIVVVGTTGSVITFGLTDPSHPRALSTLTSQAASSVVLKGNYLYVGDTRQGAFKVVDISDPTSPVEITSLPIFTMAVLAADSLAYLATDTGLAIVNISNPLSPFVVGATGTSGGRSRVHLAKGEKFIYMAYDALHVVDVSNLLQPAEVAPLPYGFLPEDVAARGDTVYVVSPDEGIWIVKNNLVTSAIDEPSIRPLRFALFQNYPNPFNPSTRIRFSLQVSGFTSLKVYDIFGRQVATLLNEKLENGEHEAEWSAGGLASGVYFYRLTTKNQTITRKMLLIR